MPLNFYSFTPCCVQWQSFYPILLLMLVEVNMTILIVLLMSCFTEYSLQVKQEPLSSPPAQGAKPVVNKRKKRGASEELDRVCEVASARVKSEAPAPEPEQLLHFTPFQPSKWRETFNADFQNLVTPALRVTADKGFNFSPADDAFIAQKKNHFQLSCCVAAGGEGEHALVTTERGCQRQEGGARTENTG